MQLKDYQQDYCDVCQSILVKRQVIRQYCFTCKREHSFGRYICYNCQKRREEKIRLAKEKGLTSS